MCATISIDYSKPSRIEDVYINNSVHNNLEESRNDSYPDGDVNVAHRWIFHLWKKLSGSQPISSKRKRHISKVATHLEVYSNDYYPDGDVHRTESLHLENQHPDSKVQDNKNKPIGSKRRRRIPKVYTPNGSENTVYCLCQQENCRWYIVCNVQKMGCLKNGCMCWFRMDEISQ